MSFLDTCIQDSLPIWRSCMETPFLRGVADGTLDEECFKGYIVDDSLYLREYSKVFAWGILHSSDMEEIRNYYTLLAFVNEAEDSTRRYYLKRYGLKDEEIQPLPLRPENRAYVDYMLNAAQNAVDAADCMMACLPCMLSYGWLFQKLLQRSPAVKDTYYGALVLDYAGPGYDAACRAWAERAEVACTGLSPERAARCRAIFRACSEHELRFWELCAAPRTDI
mgnify:CR=1 FL=1